MLRLPKFELCTPTTLAEAVALLAESPDAMIVAGGTDLVPNMKHELFTPSRVVSLAQVRELRGICRNADGSLAIGAMTSLAGPQLRTMGTLGGNVLLDTRCQWYNQTYFWRQALGFCMKKDGEVCHVVKGGKNCVAAASNDSAPTLMTLGATLEFASPRGRRAIAIDDFWVADGIFNKKVERDEVLVSIQVPKAPAGHRGAYGKLRDRGSIDFPLLGVAVRLDLDAQGAVEHADVVVTALAAQPKRITKLDAILRGQRPGTPEFEAAVAEAAALAHKQCKPLPNIPGDADYRRDMVPVYVKRTLLAASRGEGPVHHV